jgi:hypothetical protein
MPTVFRLSLVKMIYAKFKKRGTPDPFLEIRAFCFLPQQPTATLEARWQRELLKAIKEIEDVLLDHINLDPRNYDIMLDTRKTSISVKQLTKFFKIEIEGWEVEQVDIDEIMQDDPDHRYFRKERIEVGSRLKLNTGVIYRYMAFYNPDGTLKKPDYDEKDIREMLGTVRIAQQRIDFIKRRLNVVLSSLSQNVNLLEDAISDMEKLQRKILK